MTTGECGYHGEDCGGTSNNSSSTDWPSYVLGAFIQFSNDMTLGVYYNLIGGEPNDENESFQRGRHAGRAASVALAGTLAVKGVADTAAGISMLSASGGPALACEIVSEGACTVVAVPVLAGEGAVALGGILESGWASGIIAYSVGNPLSGGSGNSAQWKKLSPGEIKILQENGINVENIKISKHAGPLDLYKDKFGNIYIKVKGGIGPGEETGLNIYDLARKIQK